MQFSLRIPPQHSEASGFSLLELMVCIGILTTGIIFIVEIFSTMLNASTKGADWSVATYLAAAKLDRMLYNTSLLNYDMASATGGVLTGDSTPYRPGATEPSGVASVNNTTYYFTYTFTTIVGPPRALYQVDVQVSWFEPNATTTSATTSYGKLTTHLNRLIYVH